MIGRLKREAKRVLTPMVQALRKRQSALSPETWGFSVGQSGHLTYEGVSLPDLRGAWGSPLHVVLAGQLRRNVEAFLAANSDGRSRVEVYYSYKTNPIPGVLRMLHELGIGAEVISEYELWLAFKLGVPPSRIIYNGPVKSVASIREAVEREILLLNANHREEIATLAAVARDVGKRPGIGVRVTTSAGWAGQFGVPIAGGHAFAALKDVRDSGVLDLRAIHSHLGGMIRTAQQAREHVREVLALADRVREELGVEIAILDFGGSLATPTVAALRNLDRKLSIALQSPVPPPVPEETIAIRAYVDCVLEEVEGHYQRLQRPCPRVMLEPGRAMTGNTQVLIASVSSCKSAEPLPGWAILDAGINVAEPMQSEFHKVFPANRMHDADAHCYRLAGPICSPGDVLAWAAPLPALAAGDALAIMDAGAYFVPFATSFSFPQPAIVMLDGGDVRLLRRAETFSDLVVFDADVQALTGTSL